MAYCYFYLLMHEKKVFLFIRVIKQVVITLPLYDQQPKKNGNYISTTINEKR
jgi:hypothetical protein